MANNLSQMRTAMVMGAKTLLRLNVREHGGANRGEVVDELTKRQGGQPGVATPWCASFWAGLYELACGVTSTAQAFDPGMSTGANVAAARKVGRITSNPMPGDCACFKGQTRTGYQHTGMVLTPPDVNGNYLTIEGNNADAVRLVNRNTSQHPATYISCE